LKKKISKEDLKIWKEFISSEKPLEDKDAQLGKKNNVNFKIRTIDLHGFTLDKANKEIENLLINYYKENINKIIIITGKGNRSQKENDPYVSKDLSILRYSVPEFIKNNSNLKKIIKNITKAEIQDGGDGAFYVYLKKFKE
tara:strand:+ start:80 stop:502 length:423 start_codon:yes stop_codon:yes gene_type:complete